jgi:EAL domain-containing protein (putative c-di-GMP-specific phosphodiesterase class I)
MQAHAARTLVLENALRRALEREQLQLYYQPLVELRTGRVTGAEALLRWRHPEFGTVSPVEFIPVAEASGLVGAIGEWVLRTAVKQLKAWFDSGLPRFSLAVNLSAMQFRHVHLPDLITEILESSQMPAEYLELELTEGAAMEDPLRAIAVMDDLHARGIRMSIDDFGTGYSSLSYLKRFHVYKLKIDQSFVRDITDDPEDKAIVSAIIHMASSLGLQTIAEGVETEGQLAFLRQQDCDEAQGYLFSRPLAPAQFEAFMRDLQDHH